MVSEVVTKQDWHVRVTLSNGSQLNFIVDAETGREALKEAQTVKPLFGAPDDSALEKGFRWEAYPSHRNIRQVRRKYLNRNPIVPRGRHF